MGRRFRVARLAVVASLALIFLTAPVVATETWREYESWEDRPLGILDKLFSLTNHDLPPMPEWDCDKSRPPRLEGGVFRITLHTVGTAVNPYTELQWESLLTERLRVPVDVVPGEYLGNVDTARQIASADRAHAHLALQDGYFRGPSLNEKVEGVACTNFAVINADAKCQEGVAAHELGHVLGLAHGEAGLMRARAAPCPATLTPIEVAYLLAHSRAAPLEV